MYLPVGAVAKIRSKERKHTCTFARIQTFPDHLPALLQLYNAPRLKTSAQPPEKPLPHRKEAYPKSSWARHDASSPQKTVSDEAQNRKPCEKNKHRAKAEVSLCLLEAKSWGLNKHIKYAYNRGRTVVLYVEISTIVPLLLPVFGSLSALNKMMSESRDRHM